MRNAVLATLLALAAAAGCTKASNDKSETSSVPTITVDQVDQAIAAKAAQAVDANGADTRKNMGVVPGAILLSDTKTELDPAELPADKSKELVFYCANTHCGASHHAAEQATTAGYTHVKVMPEGIAGWVKAGKNVQKI